MSPENNYPIAVKSLGRQRIEQESKAVGSTFFDQPAHSDELSHLGTFKSFGEAANKGVLLVQFDKERMIAGSVDGTLNLWNWRDNEKEAMQIAVKVKDITCFQYDEDMLIVGTGEGVVHLFDSRTFKEKWSVRLGEHVVSLNFLESALLVITQSADQEQLWWMDISREDMRLLNRRSVHSWIGCENQIPGIFMYSDTSFLYHSRYIVVYDMKSADRMIDDKKGECCLTAPTTISTLNVTDLISTKRVVVAGCMNGMIAMWLTSQFMSDQSPVKTFQGHTNEIMSLCSLNGHLLSLDERGKLLMWSGYDLENKNVTPVPRSLTEYFNDNETNLAAHGRWFASCSFTNDIINVWTVPDLWLLTG